MKRQHALAFVLAAVLIVSGFTVGAVNNQKIEAVLVHDVSFNVDGRAWSPKDVDGSPLTPIIYNGRTYVPVRSLLEDKGVTVGFDDNTRTVLLDYSTLTVNTAPLLIKTTPGNDKAAYKDFTLTRNPNFNLGNIKFEQEYSFNLGDNTTVTADGKALNLAEAVRTKWSGQLNSAKFEVDERTGAIKSVALTTLGGSGSDQDQQKRVDIEIEISGPPWKLKITIKF